MSVSRASQGSVLGFSYFQHAPGRFLASFDWPSISNFLLPDRGHSCRWPEPPAAAVSAVQVSLLGTTCAVLHAAAVSRRLGRRLLLFKREREPPPLGGWSWSRGIPGDPGAHPEGWGAPPPLLFIHKHTWLVCSLCSTVAFSCLIASPQVSGRTYLQGESVQDDKEGTSWHDSSS